MKRFKFSLEVLLEKRKREEDAIKRELAHKNREIYTAQCEVYELEQQLKQLQEGQKKGRATASDVVLLRFSVSYRNKLKLDMLKKGKTIYELQRQRAGIRALLTKAMQNRKALELIKEKQYQEWLEEHKRREQVFIDDVSQQGFIRKRKTAQKAAVL